MNKALIINPYWDSMGGGERYVASFIKLLLVNNWQVDIVWSKPIDQEIYTMFGLDISKASIVSNKVFTSKYDLAFYVSDGSLPLSFAKKTIIHFQFPFSKLPRLGIINKIKTMLYTFVCNSEFTKKYIDHEYRVNSYVIHPPITTDEFTAGKKQKIILYVGRFSQLTQRKNQHLLIEAFSEISKKLPKWKLMLVGGTGTGADSKYIQTLRSSVKKLPITIIENPKFSIIKQLYAEASIFWSAVGIDVEDVNEPMKVEHFGMSVVEAMSAGCIPIVTNKGGYKEIVIQNESGILIKNLSELQQETLKVANNPDLITRLSNNVQARSKLFDISKFNKKFLEII